MRHYFKAICEFKLLLYGNIEIGAKIVMSLWPFTRPLTLILCIGIISVNGNYSSKFLDDTTTGTLWQRFWQTDRQAGGRTDRVVDRAAWSQLKRYEISTFYIHVMCLYFMYWVVSIPFCRFSFYGIFMWNVWMTFLGIKNIWNISGKTRSFCMVCRGYVMLFDWRIERMPHLCWWCIDAWLSRVLNTLQDIW